MSEPAARDAHADGIPADVPPGVLNSLHDGASAYATIAARPAAPLADVTSATPASATLAPATRRAVRYGHVIRVRPERLDEYRRLHAAVWPGVLRMIAACNIRNYTIYHHDGLLFSHYEYVGDDHAADMARMAADAETQRWWQATAPCQEPVAGAPEGAWWTPAEELFHAD